MKHDYSDQLTFLMGLVVNLFFCLFICPFFFFFLRFHFPDLTFLKLFLLSFCLVLKTLACHYNCLFLRSVILFQRAEMRGILINFEPPEEIKYQELESGNPYMCHFSMLLGTWRRVWLKSRGINFWRPYLPSLSIRWKFQVFFLLWAKPCAPATIYNMKTFENSS